MPELSRPELTWTSMTGVAGSAPTKVQPDRTSNSGIQRDRMDRAG